MQTCTNVIECCRSKKIPQNDHSSIKIGFDTAKTGSRQVCCIIWVRGLASPHLGSFPFPWIKIGLGSSIARRYFCNPAEMFSSNEDGVEEKPCYWSSASSHRRSVLALLTRSARGDRDVAPVDNGRNEYPYRVLSFDVAANFCEKPC